MLLNKKISIWYFISQIKYEIFFILIFAISISVLDDSNAFQSATLPLNIPTLLGTSISLLLAFRTAQSYERWWEARIVWGAIVNDSRSFIRLIIQFLPTNDTAIKDFSERQIIWVYALGETLRKQKKSKKVQSYLIKYQIKANNIPNALLDEHSIQLKKVILSRKLTNFQENQLNDLLVKLCDSMGKCERLKNTVFPRSYSLLVHVLIYIFTVMLPFAISHNQLIIEIIVTFLIPIIFIAIEKTSVIMQDPFENTPVDTPMTSIAQTIEINIREMIGEQNVPQKQINNNYYEM